jgi:hypothetical protein
MVVVKAFLATRATGGSVAVVVPAKVRSQAEGLDFRERERERERERITPEQMHIKKKYWCG